MVSMRGTHYIDHVPVHSAGDLPTISVSIQLAPRQVNFIVVTM